MSSLLPVTKDAQFKETIMELYYCIKRINSKYSRASDGWKEWIALEEAIQKFEQHKNSGQFIIAPEWFD